MNLNMLQSINNQLMYKDKLTVFRFIKSENADGSNTRTFKAVSELTDVPCKLDIKTADDSEHEAEVNTLKAVYKLFTGKDKTFKTGDCYCVIHEGQEYKLTGGLPVVYLVHQEIPIIQEGYA